MDLRRESDLKSMLSPPLATAGKHRRAQLIVVNKELNLSPVKKGSIEVPL